MNRNLIIERIKHIHVTFKKIKCLVDVIINISYIDDNLIPKKYRFRQNILGYFQSVFKTGNIERIPGLKPYFNMMRKMIRAIIYVEMV